MPSPSLTFALLLATLYGALTHMALGGNGSTLLSDIVTSWLGFALGQGVGLIIGLTALSIGSTYILAGTLGAVIALATKRVLARRRHAHE